MKKSRKRRPNGSCITNCRSSPVPSGLPAQHIVTEAAGAEAIFVGQQWLEPGDRVLLHTHPVEEALTFMSGIGEAWLGRFDRNDWRASACLFRRGWRMDFATPAMIECT